MSVLFHGTGTQCGILPAVRSPAVLVRVLKSTRVILLILICFVWWCSAFCFLPNKQTSLSLNVRRRVLNAIPTVTNYFVFKNGVGPCVWMDRLLVRKQWKKNTRIWKNYIYCNPSLCIFLNSTLGSVSLYLSFKPSIGCSSLGSFSRRFTDAHGCPIDKEQLQIDVKQNAIISCAACLSPTA